MNDNPFEDEDRFEPDDSCEDPHRRIKELEAEIETMKATAKIVSALNESVDKEYERRLAVSGNEAEKWKRRALDDRWHTVHGVLARELDVDETCDLADRIIQALEREAML